MQGRIKTVECRYDVPVFSESPQGANMIDWAPGPPPPEFWISVALM